MLIQVQITIIKLFLFLLTAYAQTGNQYKSSFGQSSFAKQSSIGTQRNQYQQNQYQQNQYQQNQYQQNQYQQNQYQQQSARQTAGSCREKNERSPVSGSCDRYIECIVS